MRQQLNGSVLIFRVLVIYGVVTGPWGERVGVNDNYPIFNMMGVGK